jgi:hypothetical protein
MTANNKSWIGWASLFAISALVAGCIAAGTRPGGEIYFTTRGAEAVIAGSVDEVEARTRKVLAKEGIAIDESSSKKGGEKREFKGDKGELTVTIEISRESATASKIEVTARKNVAVVDKDYAKYILDQIVVG